MLRFISYLISFLLSCQRALEGVDAWLAFNLTFSLLKNYAEVAIENKIQRVLFAVAANRTEYGLDITYPEITSLLDQHHINYTIVKFFPPSNIRAGPYRIVKGESRLPRPGEWNRFWTLSPKDLFEIVTFIFPNPDSYNKVYGVGPGGILDENALVQMRSQGWPRPLQVIYPKSSSYHCCFNLNGFRLGWTIPSCFYRRY